MPTDGNTREMTLQIAGRELGFPTYAGTIETPPGNPYAYVDHPVPGLQLTLRFHTPTRPSLFDKAIRLNTGSPITHVELEFPDGQCWSSIDGVGVRFVNSESLKLDAPGEWLSLSVDLTVKQLSDVRDFALSQLGKKYDWAGILGFVLPWGCHDDNDLFCSEACLRALQVFGDFPGVKAWTISPARLYAMLSPSGKVS